MKVKSVLKFVGTIGVWELLDRGIEYILNRVRGAKMDEDLGNVLTQAEQNVANVLALCAPVLTLLEDINPEVLKSNSQTLAESSLEAALNPRLNIESRIQMADRFFQCTGAAEDVFDDFDRAELLTRLYVECADGSISGVSATDYATTIAAVQKGLEDLEPSAAHATRQIIDRCIRAYELVLGVYPEPNTSVSTLVDYENAHRAERSSSDSSSSSKASSASAPVLDPTKVDGMVITTAMLENPDVELDWGNEEITVEQDAKQKGGIPA